MRQPFARSQPIGDIGDAVEKVMGDKLKNVMGDRLKKAMCSPYATVVYISKDGWLHTFSAHVGVAI